MQIYRPGTVLPGRVYNFLLHQGGLGDLIGQLPAVKYILDHHKNLGINLYVHEYAVELCEKVFKNYENIVIIGMENILTNFDDTIVKRSPYLHKISNLSIHITDHAFLTLAHTQVENCFKNYIQLDPIDVSSFNLPEKYVVVTTGYTSNSREWKPESINQTAQYILKKGYTPVFIGKSYTHAYKNDGITGNFNADYSIGINLIDKTNLFEAHSIMDGSIAVLGLDNGLIHLAGMGKAPIIAGFTTVKPEHRLPYRQDKLGYNCYTVYPKELGCAGCQSNMTFADITHDFRNCYYDDYKCLSLMTADKWIEQIDTALAPKTPEEKAEQAYQRILRTIDLNNKLKGLGIQK